MQVRIQLLPLSILFVSCEMWYPKPKMVNWEGKEMTICCSRHPGGYDCTRESWLLEVQDHCMGTAKALRSSTTERVVGKEITEEKKKRSEEYYDPHATGTVTHVHEADETKEDECVTYSCDGPIRP